MSEKYLVSVFRSPRREGMYVYIPREGSPSDLPASLLEYFGQPVHALDLVLTPERKLARADIADVIAAIQAQGFFLQMPPSINAMEGQTQDSGDQLE